MGVPKKITDLRDDYSLHLEIGLILAIGVLIFAFRVNLPERQSFQVTMQKQEAVEVTEIQQTKQEEKPPPPPRPPVPEEVPNNEVIEEDQPNFDASLDMDESLRTEAPPPSSAEDEKEKNEEREQEIFVVVEQQPKCGGIKALQKKVEYPPLARKAGIEGRVYVQFVVDEKGNITNPTVTRGVHSLLNKAALEAVKKLDCEAGKQRGKPVKVRMSLPVTFKLKAGSL